MNRNLTNLEFRFVNLRAKLLRYQGVSGHPKNAPTNVLILLGCFFDSAPISPLRTPRFRPFRFKNVLMSLTH
jgi:hypothetical protein